MKLSLVSLMSLPAQNEDSVTVSDSAIFHVRYSEINEHRNFFWQLSRDENSHGSDMPRATTASPKPSFRAPWSVGDAVVGRGNAGWTLSKSGHSCL